jgi:hypothetical protein
MLLLQHLQTAIAQLKPIEWSEVEQRAAELRVAEEQGRNNARKLEEVRKLWAVEEMERKAADLKRLAEKASLPKHTIAHTSITTQLSNEVIPLVNKYASLVYDLTILRRRLHRLKFKNYHTELVSNDHSRALWHATVHSISVAEAAKNKLKEELKELHSVSSMLIKRINVAVDRYIPRNLTSIEISDSNRYTQKTYETPHTEHIGCIPPGHWEMSG